MKMVLAIVIIFMAILFLGMQQTIKEIPAQASIDSSTNIAKIEQRIAFSNAQEGLDYLIEAVRIAPSSEEAQNLAQQSSYDEKTGVTILKISDGKKGYKNFLETNFEVGTGDGTMILSSKESGGEIKCTDLGGNNISASFYGIVEIKDGILSRIDGTTTKESIVVLENKTFVIPEDTMII